MSAMLTLGRTAYVTIYSSHTVDSSSEVEEALKAAVAGTDKALNRLSKDFSKRIFQLKDEIEKVWS
jgi:hypothetical protein